MIEASIQTYKWTKSLDNYVQGHFQDGVSIPVIAQSLNMTIEAVHYRLHQLGKTTLRVSKKCDLVYYQIRKKNVQKKIGRYIYESLVGPVPDGFVIQAIGPVNLGSINNVLMVSRKDIMRKNYRPNSRYLIEYQAAQKAENQQRKRIRELEVKTLLNDSQRNFHGVKKMISDYVKYAKGSILEIRQRYMFLMDQRNAKGQAVPAPAPVTDISDDADQQNIRKKELLKAFREKGLRRDAVMIQSRRYITKGEGSIPDLIALAISKQKKGRTNARKEEKVKTRSGVYFEYNPNKPESREVQLYAWMIETFGSRINHKPKRGII